MFFVGYGDLQDLLDDVGESLKKHFQKPFHLLKIVEPHPTSIAQVENNRHLVWVQYRVGDEIWYWFDAAGYEQVAFGNRMAEEKMEARIDSLVKCVEALIRGADFTVSNSLYARPRDLKVMQGTCKHIRYDKESDTFKLVAEESSADQA